MANNNISESENIYVKVDQNNLIYIDPNTTISPDGKLSSRGVKHEELTMYVNLEADLIPRSILLSDNDQSTLKFVAGGKLNFLNNKNNQNGSKDFDTSWTEAYQPIEDINNAKGAPIDTSGQSFGITSINIDIKGFNAIPQVTIQFTDVRGKTLFEPAENSPYNAFFHIPWPIFYLTVKGYYGKAIKYRLHLVSFKTKYNDTNGNFDSTGVFVGSTYAWLSDISLQAILNSAYMFPIESVNMNTTDGTKTSQKIVKETRGFNYLKTIYGEYKKKGYLPKNFPIKTLREVITAAKTLDKVLEQKIFLEVVDLRLFSGMKEFEDNLNDFRNAIVGWAQSNLDKTTVAQTINNIDYYYLKNDKTNLNLVLGKDTKGTLQNLINEYSTKLSKNDIFVTTLLNNTTASFSKKRFGLGDKSKFKWEAREQNTIYQLEAAEDADKRKLQENGEEIGNVLIAIDYVVNKIDEIAKLYYEQRSKFENDVERAMNEFVKRSDTGLGFEPTIKNLFAIVLANAEAFVRLMKDVHTKAINEAETRKSVIGNFTNEQSEMDIIYPWPEIKLKEYNNKQNVLVYPGDSTVSSKLYANNTKLWPEVDFIENFFGVSTNRIDSLSKKEGDVNKVVYAFDNDEDDKRILKIGTIETISTQIPYTSKIHSDFIYEIWERALNYTFIDSFNDSAIRELANFEYTNIKESIKNNDDIIKLIKDNFTSVDTFQKLLYKLAPYDKYFYYQDQLATTNYISGFYDKPYKIEKYVNSGKKFGNSLQYKELTQTLLNYKPEAYREYIYPYSSQVYNNAFSLRNGENFSIKNLEFNGFFDINTSVNFIVGEIDSELWVKENYKNNLFKQQLFIKGQATHLLNTPYFHNQLFSDYTSSGNLLKGRYVGSAYLLLNSLPFVDLEDVIEYPAKSGKKITISSLFREIGSTNAIPYHLILKWGAIYHRYKKFITTGKDILGENTSYGITGCVDNSNNTIPINNQLFFDNGNNTTYTVGPNTGITYSNSLGVHPFYDAIFSQVVNGYEHFNFTSGNTEYSAYTNNGNILTYNFSSPNGRTYYTSFIDNSKYYATDERYTILPSNGLNESADKIRYEDITSARLANVLWNTDLIATSRTFDEDTQNNFRLVWDNQSFNQPFSGKTFADPTQYNRTFSDTTKYDNYYGISPNGDYTKVYDLIATFSPQILEEFEYYFIEFASERDSNASLPLENILYNNFQNLLKEIVSVDKTKVTASTTKEIINQIYNLQKIKFEDTTKQILSESNLINLTIANPKELNPNIFHGFAEIDDVNVLQYNNYVDDTDRYLIDLYIGEEPTTDCYLNFFKNFNIEITEDNVKNFRPLVLMYAGYKKEYSSNSDESFKTYIKNNIFNKESDTNTATKGAAQRLSLFLNTVVSKLRNTQYQSTANKIDLTHGYNELPLKLELYNHFKSFNDKWVGGNSINQRNLIEEFLFLDKANRDIGNKYFLNLSRIISLEDEGNAKQSLYGAISLMIQGTGFDMKALPAYINYYGTSTSQTPKIIPSKKVASFLFGTYNEVDFQESSPKIIIQYVQNLSKRLDMQNKKKYKFLDDSFDISNQNNNPVIYELPKVFQASDIAQSNRVVAFEISFGDQNQNIFKTISLDQSTLKNTTESFVVLENLARSESGSSSHNVDVSLYNYYRQAAYSCEVTCMGNVMIQPTMYFYLKNVPMFKGTYWITEVSHSIRNNNIITTFKGARMPYTQLPDPTDSFISAYRTLFDKIQKNAVSIVNNLKTNSTAIIVTTQLGPKVVNTGTKSLEEEKVKIVNEAGYLFGIPYNGMDGEEFVTYVEMPNNGNKKYLRAYVTEMGWNYNSYNDTDEMKVITSLDKESLTQVLSPASFTFRELRTITDKNNFYSCRFNLQKVKANDLIKAKTNFYIPKSNKSFTLNHSYQLDSSGGVARNAEGPVDIGPKTKDGNFGIAMSRALMKNIGVAHGDVVYFEIL